MVGWLVLFVSALASPNGKTGVAAAGCSCHGNASSKATITLTAEPLEVEPGEVVNVSVLVEAPQGVGAGLNVAAQGGEFSVGEGLRSGPREVTHSEPTTMVDHATTFTFTWSAEADGDYKLYGAALASDGNGRDVGDWWNFPASVTVTVGAGGDPRDTAEDTGDTGEVEEPCSCASGSEAAALAPLGLVAAALTRRRRKARLG
ncbi:MAG: MYXO-CTERM sorting domain-containing protein [Myxococcales bacterium]|nr:MYXO-CTERM sorting domain-containing protein [Myxococcales bacterium]